jgi:Na+/H+-dicarboxylate symporter
LFKLKLHWWILIGIVAGALIGTVVNRTTYPTIAQQAREEVFEGRQWTAAEEATAMKAIQSREKELLRKTTWGAPIYWIGTLFLKALKMIVLPLVVSSLLSGIVGLGDLRKLGRMGGRAIGWYLTTSLLAIVTGLMLVNLFRPGVGVQIPMPAGGTTPEARGFWEMINGMLPSNPVRAAADFELIQVLLFTILFGCFTLAAKPEVREIVGKATNAVFEIMMKMTMAIISLAPIGIAALIATLVATTGPELFSQLIGYFLTVLAALMVHMFGTLPLLFWLITRRNPYKVMRAMSPALLTAFSTASSSGTLPMTLERVENKVGVSNGVSSFVLPIGATVNMDGTALYECVAVIFVSQIYAATNPDFTLTFANQVMIVFLALMVSIGAAGIPHAGLVMMVIIFEAIGLPTALTAILWAVDRPLDMCRSMINVWSDTMGTTAIAHLEKEIDESVLFRRAG